MPTVRQPGTSCEGGARAAPEARLGVAPGAAECALEGARRTALCGARSCRAGPFLPAAAPATRIRCPASDRRPPAGAVRPALCDGSLLPSELPCEAAAARVAAWA